MCESWSSFIFMLVQGQLSSRLKHYFADRPTLVFFLSSFFFSPASVFPFHPPINVVVLHLLALLLPVTLQRHVPPLILLNFYLLLLLHNYCYTTAVIYTIITITMLLLLPLLPLKSGLTDDTDTPTSIIGITTITAIIVTILYIFSIIPCG